MFCCRPSKKVGAKPLQPKQIPQSMSPGPVMSTPVSRSTTTILQEIQEYQESIVPSKNQSHHILIQHDPPFLYHALAIVPKEFSFSGELSQVGQSLLDICPISLKIKNTLGAYRYFQDATPLHLACFTGNLGFLTKVRESLGPLDKMQGRECKTWIDGAVSYWKVLDCAKASGSIKVLDWVEINIA